MVGKLGDVGIQGSMGGTALNAIFVRMTLLLMCPGVDYYAAIEFYEQEAQAWLDEAHAMEKDSRTNQPF